MGLEENGKWKVGKLKRGKKNLITDVPGVKVGHCTLDDGVVKTGVTAILPHGGNLFRDKVMAGVDIINGFGKSVGLLQVAELGTIESPILMTNTLSVGTALTALTRYMLAQNEEIGTRTGTVNCIVTECNDGKLNDIRGLHVKEEHVIAALEAASEDFCEGSLGAGTGMVCMELKGGVGSASRVLEFDGKEYVLGAIVLANHGVSGDLMVSGEPLGAKIKEQYDREKEKGSIIMVLATDVPLSERQLTRVAKRAVIGLGRTGSYLGNGSGDIAIAFSTANRVNHYGEKAVSTYSMLEGDRIDDVFRAAAETVEESVISALWHAEAATGMNGKVRNALRDYL